MSGDVVGLYRECALGCLEDFACQASLLTLMSLRECLLFLAMCIQRVDELLFQSAKGDITSLRTFNSQTSVRSTVVTICKGRAPLFCPTRATGA